MTKQSGIPAGGFSQWLEEMKKCLRGESEANVDCEDCTACCHSSYFVHIRPSDCHAIAHIPQALMFPAPGLPKGHWLLGYDDKGCCPMFVAGRCSIYEHRPQTCRQYDCRLFKATGLGLQESGKTLISRQVERWTFELSSKAERQEMEALQNAAKFLDEFAPQFPLGFVPRNTTQRAILALKVYGLFLGDPTDFPVKIAQRIESIVIKVNKASPSGVGD